jgi:hypothetical protein
MTSDIQWIEWIIVGAGSAGSIAAGIFIYKTWRSGEAVREQENRHFLVEREMNAIDY